MKKYFVTVSLIVNPSRDSHLAKPETQERHYLIEAETPDKAKRKAEDGASRFMSTWDIKCREITDIDPLDKIELSDIEFTQRKYHN